MDDTLFGCDCACAVDQHTAIASTES